MVPTQEHENIASYIHLLKHCWSAIDLGLRSLFFNLSKLKRACLARMLILTVGLQLPLTYIYFSTTE